MYQVTIFVDSDGTTYGASETDQAGVRRYPTYPWRTVSGRHVYGVGRWYGSQMSYRPYLRAVAEGRDQATRREARRIRIVDSCE